MDVIILVVVIALSILLYFLPSIVAAKRNHKNMIPVFLLNIFLGWTFLGWVVALVWSFAS